MSSLTGNKKAFIIAALAAGLAVASLAITTPLASAQNATSPMGNQTGGNQTTPGGNTTATAFEYNLYQTMPPAPPAGNQTGGNQTTPGGNTTS